MKTSTLLAITLPCILVPTLLACIIFARFKFRSLRRSRSAPVDPGHEARMNRFAQQKVETAQKEGWTVGLVLDSNWYGVTPVAGVGPNGTRTFFNGWFGLDGGRAAGKIRLPLAGLELCTSAQSGDSKGPPHAAGPDSFNAGWSSIGDVESTRAPSYSATPRESNFSRASRASRRSQISSRNTGVSSLGPLDELGRLEKGPRRNEIDSLDDGESFIEAGSRASESLMMREREPDREQV